MKKEELIKMLQEVEGNPEIKIDGYIENTYETGEGNLEDYYTPGEVFPDYCKINKEGILVLFTTEWEYKKAIK